MNRIMTIVTCAPRKKAIIVISAAVCCSLGDWPLIRFCPPKFGWDEDACETTSGHSRWTQRLQAGPVRGGGRALGSRIRLLLLLLVVVVLALV
jgi:hypothetical protein